MPDHPSTSRPRRSTARPAAPGEASASGGVLVTGADTPVGRGVVERLLAAGTRVVAVSPGLAPAAVPGLVQIDAEVAGDAWERWCEGCEAAVHLPDTRRAPRSAAPDPVQRRETARVVRTCSALGIRRLVAVSALAAGPAAPTRVLRGLAAAEDEVRGSGLRWTLLRPADVFGPGTPFSTVLERLVRPFPLVVLAGPGTSLLQPIASEDVARAVVAAVGLEDATGLTIPLGGPERLTLNELLRRTAAALGLRRTLVHLPVGAGRALVRLRERLADPPLTDEELTALLAGATCDGDAAAARLAEPAIRYGGPAPA